MSMTVDELFTEWLDNNADDIVRDVDIESTVNDLVESEVDKQFDDLDIESVTNEVIREKVANLVNENRFVILVNDVKSVIERNELLYKSCSFLENKMVQIDARVLTLEHTITSMNEHINALHDKYEQQQRMIAKLNRSWYQWFWGIGG